MCLSSVTVTYNVPQTEKKTGVKLVRKYTDGTYHLPFCSLQGSMQYSQSDRLEVGMTYRASIEGLYAEDGSEYLSGFHIFPTLEDYRKYAYDPNDIPAHTEVALEVEYWDVTAEGQEIIYPCDPAQMDKANIIVARRMRVIRAFTWEETWPGYPKQEGPRPCV